MKLAFMSLECLAAFIAAYPMSHRKSVFAVAGRFGGRTHLVLQAICDDCTPQIRAPALMTFLEAAGFDPTVISCWSAF